MLGFAVEALWFFELPHPTLDPVQLSLSSCWPALLGIDFAGSVGSFAPGSVMLCYVMCKN